MSLQFKQLLARDAQLPAPIRDAISSGEIRTAAKLLMTDFGLDCIEVSLLLDEPLCGSARCSGP